MKMKSIAWTLQLILALSVTATLAAANDVQVNVLTKSTESWNKNSLPQYPQGQPQVTILRILIPPGSVLPLHTHPVINAGVLIKGKLTVITKTGQTLHMKAGDPIVEVVNTWHYGKNEGVEPADIIVFYAGVKDTLITVKE
jgi:quercetin dioxygenase-like cupin family protein